MATRAVPAPLAQLPNVLTIARLVLIPVFVVLVLDAGGEASWPAGIVFGVAGITDQVDGFLARRWHVESGFGKIADPLADRLVIEDRLPWPALVVILARDALLLVGYKVLVPRGYDFEVNMAGKVATWLLYASVALVLVTDEGTEWPLWIFWIGLGLAVLAAVDYGLRAWRTVR
jgi:CDP-diacylglycerol--glycerol-3-phosphate 3-phosphatidyltransferase